MASIVTTPRIRPLKDSVILYVDETSESREAAELLEQAGVQTFLTDGPVEPLDSKPLAIYLGGSYQGLKEIEGLLRLLEFWSNQSPLIQRELFRDT